MDGSADCVVNFLEHILSGELIKRRVGNRLVRQRVKGIDSQSLWKFILEVGDGIDRFALGYSEFLCCESLYFGEVDYYIAESSIADALVFFREGRRGF